MYKHSKIWESCFVGIASFPYFNSHLHRYSKHFDATMAVSNLPPSIKPLLNSIFGSDPVSSLELATWQFFILPLVIRLGCFQVVWIQVTQRWRLWADGAWSIDSCFTSLFEGVVFCRFCSPSRWWHFLFSSGERHTLNDGWVTMMRVVEIVEEFGRNFRDFIVIRGRGIVEVIQKEAYEVAQGAVKAVLDFILSSEWA